MSSTRWFFLSNKQTIIKKKKNVRNCQEENNMAVDREREADGDYLSFWDAKNDFL